MLIFKAAQLAGGLRLLLLEAAPLVAVSVGMLSARTVAYVVGFGLGSIGFGWLSIIAALVAVTGFFNAGANNSQCEAYRAQMRAIDNANRVVIANYNANVIPLIAACSSARSNYIIAARAAISSQQIEDCRNACGVNYDSHYGCSLVSGCLADIENKIQLAAPVCTSPPPPQLQTYPACSSPNCPPGKKVWVQVLWGSPTGNFVDSKGCFIVAYSQDAPTIPVNIEYNPFLPKPFVQSRATSYYLVDGDRFRGLQDNDWKNLESVPGWDKGYWKAEQTDSECRGWRPGWSRKVK